MFSFEEKKNTEILTIFYLKEKKKERNRTCRGN